MVSYEDYVRQLQEQFLTDKSTERRAELSKKMGFEYEKLGFKYVTRNELSNIENEARQYVRDYTPPVNASNSRGRWQRFSYAISEIAKAKEFRDVVSDNTRDLQLGISAEIGEDGAETYFESYMGTIKTGIVNIFIGSQYHNLFLLGSI